MKLAVISDIHSNLAALEAFFDNEEYDDLLVLGDVIGYGPNPTECLGRIMGRFDADVQGNHDYALANHAPVGCREDYLDIAEAVIEWTRPQVTGEPLLYLQYMPLRSMYAADGVTYAMVHGSPLDRLHKYMDADADEEDLITEIADEEGDAVLAGHTHVPFIRQAGPRLIINPGSIGLPRDGVAEISYAIIDGGDPQIIRRPYDIERTIHDVSKMDVPDSIKKKLIHIYRTATDPV